MEQSVDAIQFGNMSQECLYWIGRATYLDKHFTALTTFTFPANSSEGTKKELQQVADSINTLKQHPDQQKQFIQFDRRMYVLFKEIIDQSPAIENKDRFNQMIDAIVADSSPLIYKLKEYFKRPRPNQLAAAYKLKLFPFKSISQDCASYPSAHVYHAKIICEVIGNLCPQLHSNMQLLFADIYRSRISLGTNYPSDADAAVCAAIMVLEDEEFKVKYQL